MSKAPFKLKSGNKPLFKMMGSSPNKADTNPYEGKGFLDTELGENLTEGESSPAKDGTYVRLSDPPQYPKHHHEKNKQGRKVVVMDSGWTTDASKQHTRSEGPNKEDLEKRRKEVEKLNKKDRKKPKDQKKKDINVPNELAPEYIEPSSPNKQTIVEGEWDYLKPKWEDIDWKKAGGELSELFKEKFGIDLSPYINKIPGKRKKPKYGKVNYNDYNIKDYEGSENQRKKMEEWEERTKDQTSVPAATADSTDVANPQRNTSNINTGGNESQTNINVVQSGKDVNTEQNINSKNRYQVPSHETTHGKIKKKKSNVKSRKKKGHSGMISEGIQLAKDWWDYTKPNKELYDKGIPDRKDRGIVQNPQRTELINRTSNLIKKVKGAF